MFFICVFFLHFCHDKPLGFYADIAMMLGDVLENVVSKF